MRMPMAWLRRLFLAGRIVAWSEKKSFQHNNLRSARHLHPSAWAPPFVTSNEKRRLSRRVVDFIRVRMNSDAKRGG
jgi:hypothetical protein